MRFSGPSAEAVALGKLGIGDEVLLELNGATWVEGGGDSVRTPGRSVDGELVYEGEVGLQKAGGEWVRSRQSKTPQMEDTMQSTMQSTMQTPTAQNGARAVVSRMGPGAFGGTVPIYSSPAFVRRARVSGNGFGDSYDPFTGEYDDLEAEGPRKRARVSFGGLKKWRLAGRTPSPEVEDQTMPRIEADADVEMNEDVENAEESTATQGQENVPLPSVVDFAHASQMAPPAPPQLDTSKVSTEPTSGIDSIGNGPSTPNLRPVPSSALPLPSPFPTGPPAADLNAASDTNKSAAATDSQRDLTLSQSLPDTADPDDDESSPTGIYAHNSAIEGTYREHVAHREYLSDTEEDEGLYEEHMKTMREEGLRDDHIYDDNENDEQEVDEDDVEEVIEDMGEEPEESSDESAGDTENEEEGSEAPSVVAMGDNEVEPSETLTPAEDRSQKLPSFAEINETSEVSRAEAHIPPRDEESDKLSQAPISKPAPVSTAKNVPFTITAASQERRPSQPPLQMIAPPQTPAKMPAGIFGMDGTSNTPQSTPQSERDRIMARTYSSLFGFSASPAPLQSFAQTPTPSGGLTDMGRVERMSGPALESAAKSEVKAMSQVTATELDVSHEKPSGAVKAAIVDADKAASLPRTVTTEAEEPTGEQLHSTLALGSSGARQSPTPQDVNDVHEVRTAETDRQAVDLRDATMADTSSASHMSPVLLPDHVECNDDTQPAEAEDAPAAILEAAIEGEDDTDVIAQDERDQVSHDTGVIAQGEKDQLSYDNDAMADLTATGVPTQSKKGTPAPPPTQIEVIDLDSSDGEEAQEQIMETPQQPSHAEPVMSADADAINASTFPGSPTEVDSDEDGADKEDSDEDDTEAEFDESPQVSSQAAVAQDEEIEPVQDPSERVIAETLQTQDAQSILPDESEPVESFFDDQMPNVEEPQMAPAQPTKSNLSFHYFSFQSTTSAASTSFAEERQATPQAHAVEQKATTEVIELSSSPAAEPDERQASDDVGQPAAFEARTVEDDEQMSEFESFSPEPTTTQTEAHLEQDPGIEEDDEHMSEAEAFSPEVFGAQHAPVEASVETSLAAGLDKAGSASSDASGLSQSHSERILEVTQPTIKSGLPLSPETSQPNKETQLAPPAPQLDSTALPPTPQLTQGDSLIKESEVVVEPAMPEPAPLDPPSNHTRSSVDTTAEESLPPRNITPDPPSRHTRSSVEPTAEKHFRSPLQKTPSRRSARRSQTHSHVSETIAEERRLEEEEGEDTIAVLSPFPKTPARKSPRKISNVTMKETEVNAAEDHPLKKSPSKRSFTSRLSNVPDVISAWFSPRRSSRLHPDEEEVDADVDAEIQKPAFTGLSTAMGYYTPLSNLSQRTNSQARADNTVDVIAIVADSTKIPERAKAGPKDYFTCFKMWDPSLDNGKAILVEVFRPWKATLPMAEVGDVILLRGFSVKSRKRQPYLISSETSGWCVWRYAEHDESEQGRKGKKRTVSFSGIREEIKGPPVELGQEERDRVGELRHAWEELH